MRTKIFSPYWLPVWFFAGAILIGALLLHLDASHPGGPLSFVDSLFTATSAMCVTGLAVVDTGSYFSTFGLDVILVLIQLGGLGIMTFTTLIIHLLGRHVSLNDRIAVGQSLLHDPSFSLPRFLVRVVAWAFSFEALGALCLWLMDPVGFNPYSAVFHSISAFCNAGFSLYPDSLTQWAGHGGVNTVFIVLITAGGLGFYVLNELGTLVWAWLTDRRKRRSLRVSWHTEVVLKTSLTLVVAGTVVIFAAEGAAANAPDNFLDHFWNALFQSVTCRTAGFNTVDIGGMTNVSLAFMMLLMLIGGSPGSCAGGIKTTTFRALMGFVWAEFRGWEQVRIGRFALDQRAMNKVVSLVTMTFILVGAGTMVLTSLESGDSSYLMARGEFIADMFETISAFATVGLSTGMTPLLDDFERVTLIVLMFVGRLGPIWLLSALQSWQTERRYKVPTSTLPFG
ncbi:MAG: TrkH family potassium uptake protein [Pseudodesulfovibrio sp.]|jgi:trk system potassium uptake protein TrkH|uniref:Potassium transporter TrkH n=1 Tax=Pseudodesulfovibrio indicus TaxID=1716143 RepID=A0A126QNQ0_9BACT|nr:potassium transporter TrkG [Pseudodesulfovibrio indicus]AMK11447.1 potassium transporter TrkH [Pseudodesulfovibrio indicus]TDT89840.1 trk system potassium uptake protein TrkH [Pseudodesulfovibrio indicus]